MRARKQFRLPGVRLLFAVSILSASAGAAENAAPPDVMPGDVFETAARVEAALLEEQRGGADTVYNDIQTSGVVGNNQAWNLNTGANTIADGAFVGANGLSTVVQNSGNNVLIQNSTIINIQLK